MVVATAMETSSTVRLKLSRVAKLTEKGGKQIHRLKIEKIELNGLDVSGLSFQGSEPNLKDTCCSFDIYTGFCLSISLRLLL